MHWGDFPLDNWCIGQARVWCSGSSFGARVHCSGFGELQMLHFLVFNQSESDEQYRNVIFGDDFHDDDDDDDAADDDSDNKKSRSK